MARLKSALVVAAIAKLASAKNGAAYISRKGEEAAGAIFITLYDRESRAYHLYEPTPQILLAENRDDINQRAFSLLDEALNDMELSERFEKESKFDPDFWIVELEGISPSELSEAVLIV